MSYSQRAPYTNNNSEQTPHKRTFGNEQRVPLFLGLLALTCAAILFGLRVKAGLRFFELGDETEKLVAAQMLNQGLHLYRDIFAHHGPIPYMLAHLYSRVVSQTDFSLVRLTVVFFAAASCLSMAFSPILKGSTARAWAAAPYLSVLSSVWVLQGMHMLLYQPIGGFLFVIVLTQMAIPALIGEKITQGGLFLSGFSLTLACFSAYTFGPAAIFFVVSTLLSLMASKENLWAHAKPFSLGAIFAAAIVTIWLILFGDLLGYLIYHFYFNQKIYASFIEFSPLAISNNFDISLTKEALIPTLTAIFSFIWIYLLASIVFYELPKKPHAIILKISAMLFLYAAILLTNPRGENNFKGVAFVILNFSAISLVAAWLLQNQIRKFSLWSLIHPLMFIVLIVAITEWISKQAISSPHGIPKREFLKHTFDLQPEKNGASAFIRSITDKDEKILSLVFSPNIYIRANRLPASGHYYYLPWQAAYNRNAILDYKIDICKDITTAKPSVIWLDNWKVWDRYLVDSYEPCIPRLIKSNYTRLSSDSTLYLRKDVAHRIEVDNSSAGNKKLPSPQLSVHSPIKLSMMASDEGSAIQLKRIGVMFATYGIQNPGDAILHLKGPNGIEFIQRFSLSDLVDNSYRYFDLDSKRYNSGEISSATGGGISTWESHNEKNEFNTCIIFEYINGQIRFTSGCPFF